MAIFLFNYRRPGRKHFICLVAYLLLVFPVLHAQTNSFLKARNNRFIDSLNRQVILHGLNLVNKNREEGYRNFEKDTPYIKMRNWGMNCVRLGFMWDALEPEPGKYNEAFIKTIDERIAWAKANGLYVMLDMHQDLYGSKFGNGAPAWATLDEGLPYTRPEGVWSEAYYTSDAVQTAFDNFWADKPAADGEGVQQHLINCWKFLAQRYAKEPAVAGYDLLNEPFMGSSAKKMVEIFLMNLAVKAKETPAYKDLSLEEIMMQWANPATRGALLQSLGDTLVFSKTLSEIEPVTALFETEKLMSYYKRVVAAIREVDTNHIIFLEPSVSSNIGITTHIEKTDRSDRQQAYAPHAYDLVTDTETPDAADTNRLTRIFVQHMEAANRMQTPMIIGEWGAFYGAGEAVVPVALHITKYFEKLLCGDLYWDYYKGMEKAAYFPVLRRPYPMATSGDLVSYRYDSESKTLSMRWHEREKQAGNTVIWLPSIKNIKITGLKKGEYTTKLVKDGFMPGFLIIKTKGKNITREIGVKMN